MYKMISLLLLFLCASCANIIGDAPDPVSVAPVQSGPVIDDEEVLRKTLISLRKQDQQEQALRVREQAQAKQPVAKTPLPAHRTESVPQSTTTAVNDAQKGMRRGKLWIRIPFKSGYTSVNATVFKALRDVAGKYLAEPRKHGLVVRGFCDAEPIGGYAGNHRSRHHFKSQLALSKARAQAVADILVRAGIRRDLIQVEAYGANYFIADNQTLAGRNKNRRVDVFLADQ